MDRDAQLTRLYEALGAGDFATLREHCHEDVEVVERLEVPGAQVFHGIEEFERGYRREGDAVTGFRVDLLGSEQVGDAVVAQVRISIRGRSSGAEVAEEVAHLLDFRDGLIARWRAFNDVADARRCAREETVRRLYDLWQEGRLEDALALVHPDIVWAEPEETIGARRAAGVESARDQVRDWTGSYDRYSGEVTGVEVIGDHVVVDFQQRVRGRGSSVDVESPIFHVWELNDGLPVRMEMFFDREQALDRVGR